MSLTPITRTLAVATLAGLSFSSPTVAQGLGNSSGWQNGWGPGYMMGQGHMPGPGYMMGQGYMNGPGYMMGQGNMPRPGYMMGQGYMNGPGYMMGQGNMPGPGYMMGQGYMNAPGYMMGQGNMPGPGYMMAPNFQQQGPDGSGWMHERQQALDVEDVKSMMEQKLGWMNNPNIKLGNVEETDDDTITAEIVTKEGSLVQRLTVDRRTGWIQPSQ
ncbi:hypothetical protein ACFQ3C_17600 [Seohaeicola saemankumensis]|uniref:YpeB-like protein with protease inhibitory function n=1 Tax=Seohaeicola saemankumensis TaxID=481181 RepID=A0ABW3THX2_9RHOB